MQKTLILIAGSPATGKTYLINQIRTIIPDMFIVTPDEGKEILADSVGFNNLAEKAELEKQVWQFYYDALALYMSVGKKVVLSEYPFSHKQADKLTTLAQKYNYQIITIRLIADFDVLWQRRKIRDVEKERHLSHIVSSYHYGDELVDRRQADNLITESAFKEIIANRGYEHFQLGKLYEFDVSDFAQVDYSSLLIDLQKDIE